MRSMTDHLRLMPLRLMPALTFLVALSAVALPPTRGQTTPSTPAVAAPQRSSCVLDVADQQQPRRQANRRNSRLGDTGDAQVEQLNETSLQRARQGQDSPGAGPDTTSNLNSMSERD